MKKTILLAGGAATVAALAIGGTVAFGAIPAPDGTITACYVKAATDTGAISPMYLRDTAKSGSCPTGYTTLTWKQQGVPGPVGPSGPPGPMGPAGPAGTVSISVITGTPVVIAPATSAVAFANCPSGKHVTGGGYTASDNTTDAVAHGLGVGENHPNADAGWLVNIFNQDSTDPITVTAYAICS